MKCSYHPAVDFQEGCSICKKPLCGDCTHRIKGHVYCQDCLVQGTETMAAMKRLHMPSDAPRRAAWCSLIPGMGAVYNSDYLKAITHFAVFAALVMLGNRVHGVFGFGALAFLIFTLFDSYRSAEARARKLVDAAGLPEAAAGQDKSIIAWGIFLIILGILFLLQNIIPYHFLYRLWPLVFVLLGGYLVYHSLQDRKDSQGTGTQPRIGEE